MQCPGDPIAIRDQVLKGVKLAVLSGRQDWPILCPMSITATLGNHGVSVSSYIKKATSVLHRPLASRMQKFEKIQSTGFTCFFHTNTRRSSEIRRPDWNLQENIDMSHKDHVT